MKIDDAGIVDTSPPEDKVLVGKYCVQCFREMDKWIGVNAYVCEHPDCPNYGLYQVGVSKE
jgi:hypothetical protein